MSAITAEFMSQQLELADQLLAGRDIMLEPRDLPGRYGRTVRALEHILRVAGIESVIAGGWAVWRHGYLGRVTQDIDIVLPADQITEFVSIAAVSGFEVLPQPEGRWPKVRFKDTDIKVDILPEGARPGTETRPAPTTIPAPVDMGGVRSELRYIRLESLVELKIAAGRTRDEADIAELIRTNIHKLGLIRTHLGRVHPDYAATFDRLVKRVLGEHDR